MLQPLPYHPALGRLLRSLAPASLRPCWLRLEQGRRELFAADPVAGILLSNQPATPSSESTVLYKDNASAFWEALPSLLARLTPGQAAPGGRFRGGLMGFVGYGPAPDRQGVFPTAWMGLYPCFIEIDHEAKAAWLVCLARQEALTPAWQALVDAVTILAADAAREHTSPESGPGHAPGGGPGFRLLAPFAPLTSPARYRESFARIQAWLHSGDCYQVNYTQCFRAPCAGSGAAAMERLLATSSPGHAAWLALPEGEIMSLSPELFLRVEDGFITTRPIKGTAPRGRDDTEDQALRRELEESPKNRAENLMIVDLLRHDIGQHAITGSVRVERLFEVESLPQVHHLVSTVTGRLRPGSHVVDLVRDCFPGGSITGAPKKRAMEIIAELEDASRSVYCGSIGFLGSDGEVELNIAIRTLLRVGDEIFAWAGGGIVADSECESEYEECFHKIGALLRALEQM